MGGGTTSAKFYISESPDTNYDKTIRVASEQSEKSKATDIKSTKSEPEANEQSHKPQNRQQRRQARREEKEAIRKEREVTPETQFPVDDLDYNPKEISDESKRLLKEYAQSFRPYFLVKPDFASSFTNKRNC